MATARPSYLTLCIGGLFAFGLALGLMLVPGTTPALGEGLTLEGLQIVIAQKFPEVPFIQGEALARAMHDDDKARRPRLLDTRSAAEYAVSQLHGAVRVDPDTSDLGVAGSDKRAPIVVYCSVGYRSATIGQRLVRAGFTNVRNLAFGIFGWANAGRPVYRGEQVVSAVHPYDAVWGLLLREDLRKMPAP